MDFFTTVVAASLCLGTGVMGVSCSTPRSTELFLSKQSQALALLQHMIFALYQTRVQGASASWVPVFSWQPSPLVLKEGPEYR